MADAELGIAVKVSGANDLDSLNKKLQETAKNKDQLDFKFSQPIGGQKDFGFSDSFNKATDQAQKYQQAMSATAQSQNLLQRGLSGVGNAFSSVIGWFRGGTVELGHATTATHGFREAMRTLNPIIYSAGGSIQGLGVFAGLARAGIVGLAAGLTGALVVSLQVAGDNVNTMRRSLEQMFGVKGDELFGQIKRIASETKSSLSSVKEGVENYLTSVYRLQSAPPEMEEKPSIIISYENGFPEFKTIIEKYISAAGELDKHVGPTLGPGVPGRPVIAGPGVTGATEVNDLVEKGQNIKNVLVDLQTRFGVVSSVAKQNVNDFFAAFDKEGKLTADAFDQMAKQGSPLRPIALALADAFGKGNNQLEKMVDLSQQLRDHVDKYGVEWKARKLDIDDVKSAIEAAGKATSELPPPPPTLKQQFDDLKTSVENFWAALGSTQGTTAFSTALESLTGVFDNWKKKLEEGKGIWETFFTPPQGWGDMFRQLDDLMRRRQQLVSPGGAQNPTPVEMAAGGLPGIATGQLGDQATDAAADVSKLTGSVEGVGTSSTNATDPVNNLGSSVTQFADASGNAATRIAAAAAVVNAAAGAAAAGGGGGPSFAVGGGGEEGYATGGAFTVGGSQNVRFTATKGEIVSIVPPSGDATSFAVEGASGADKVPIGFRALPGTIVTIAPTPDSARQAGLAYTGGGGATGGGYRPGQPTSAFGGTSLPMVRKSPANDNAATSQADTLQARRDAYQKLLLFIGQAHLTVPLDMGWLGYMNPDLAEGTTAMGGGGSISVRGASGGWTSPHWTTDWNRWNQGGGGQSYGSYQSGGQFVVGGNAKKISGGNDKTVTINVIGNVTAGSFMQAEAQIKRAVRRGLT